MKKNIIFFDSSYPPPIKGGKEKQAHNLALELKKENLINVLLGKHKELKGTIHEGKIIESVIHFAAYTFVGESMKNPMKYYLNNLVDI